MSIQYSGGTYVSTTFLGDTKAHICSGIESALTTAGWTVVSGSGTTNLLMETAAASGSGNQGRVRCKDNSGTCIQVTIENVSGSKAQSNSTTVGGSLLPGATNTFRIIATKYQFFCFIPGASTPGRGFVAAGILFIPSFLWGSLTEAIWMGSNCHSDSDTAAYGSFRTRLGFTYSGGLAAGNSAAIMNGSLLSLDNGNQADTGPPILVTPGPACVYTAASAYRWHDYSNDLSEPLFACGSSALSDEALIRGQLYDCVVSSDAYNADTTTSFTDAGTTHNFWNLTHNNTGSSTFQRGCLWVATS